MTLVDPRIEAYAEEITSAPPDHLAALDADTRAALGQASMLSGPVVGRLLELLVVLQRPRLVLEIGTFSGGSALWMAGALEGDARLITLEADPEHAAFARERFARAGADGARIELREGDALTTLAELDGPFDLVFIDADKTGYPAYLEAVLPKLAPRGLVVADNMLRDGRVLEDDPDPGTRAVQEYHARVAADPGLVSVLLTVRDGLTLVRRA